LLEASRAAAEADNLQDALEIIVRCAAQALDMPACIVYEFEAWGDLAMYEAKRFGRNRVYAYSMLTKTDA
jgi:PleD family two-component response regulator